MDDACRLGGGGADRNGPGADLLVAGCEIALVAQHAVGLACEGREGGLGDAGAGHHLGAVGLVEFGNLGLELGTNGDHAGPHLGGMLAHALNHGAFAFEIGLVDIGDVEDFLGSHEAEAFHSLGFAFGQLEGA